MRSITGGIKAFLTFVLFAPVGAPAFAANVSDGLISIGASDYTWNSDSGPNSKWQTHGHNDDQEYGDGSGGERYDLNFIGFDIVGNQFQFGVGGGSILSSPHLGANIPHMNDGSGISPNANLYLGDIAINIEDAGAGFEDPTVNGTLSSSWEYAIRILGIDASNNEFDFEVVSGGTWESVDIYGRQAAGQDGHHSDTFRMNDAPSSSGVLTGMYSANVKPGARNDEYVLEGSFDLDLLALFDEDKGGRIIAYLTMSCVNDEAIVYGDVAPVPVPAAIWLFGTALIGFIGVSRRTRV